MNYFIFAFILILSTSLSYAGPIVLYGSDNVEKGTAANPLKVTMIGNGNFTSNVGIGSSNPEEALVVNGNLVLKSPDGITNSWGDSLDFFGCGDNNLCFRVNANPTTSEGVFGIEYLDGTQISMVHDGTNMVLDSTVGGVSTSDFFRSAMQTVTVASNGAGTAATGTVTPTSNNIRLQCNDTDGCTMSMSETGAQTGILVVMVNNTTNSMTFADSSGVLELPGGTSIVLGQNDVLAVFYQNSTWLHAFSSNN